MLRIRAGGATRRVPDRRGRRGSAREGPEMDGGAAVEGLVSRWRERAGALRTWGGSEGAARAGETAAAELEAALRAARDELLTLEAAATESGYSADHLGRLLRAGKLPNACRPHAP